MAATKSWNDWSRASFTPPASLMAASSSASVSRDRSPAVDVVAESGPMAAFEPVDLVVKPVVVHAVDELPLRSLIRGMDPRADGVGGLLGHLRFGVAGALIHQHTDGHREIPDATLTLGEPDGRFGLGEFEQAVQIGLLDVAGLS